MNHKNHSLNNTPDISTKYTLPRYYIPVPLQTTCYLFIFINTSLKSAEKIVDSIVGSRNNVEAVKIYTETGVEKDTIVAIENYLEKNIDIDSEEIEVIRNLHLVQLLGVIGYFEQVSAYREALGN